ncbi:MAG: hypothetical protein M3321_11180, partial [Actinomycetota bacterium]|nr:hypothetical protein [Actinomycetota bacterium]
LIHVGPEGEPAIGDSGKHRLTIARLLGLSVVPARVGYVYRGAIPLLPAVRGAGSAVGSPASRHSQRRAHRA